MATISNFRICLSSEVDSKPIVNGSYLFSTDNTTLYFDENDNRVLLSIDIEFIGNEYDRLNIINPESNKLYIVFNSGKVYIYNGDWKCLNKTTEYFSIHNVSLEENQVTNISDSRIKGTDTAVFIPYPEIIDLAINDITCICSDGYVYVQNDNSYVLNGIIEVTTIE